MDERNGLAGPARGLAGHFGKAAVTITKAVNASQAGNTTSLFGNSGKDTTI
jgi:hypothetical protein